MYCQFSCMYGRVGGAHVCLCKCVFSHVSMSESESESERERERERDEVLRPFHSWTERSLIHLFQCQDSPVRKMAQHLHTMSTNKNEGHFFLTKNKKE
jgi:hypothetical protein